jgi:hypothetical protein
MLPSMRFWTLRFAASCVHGRVCVAQHGGVCVRARRTKNELVNYRKEVAAQRAKVDAMIAASEEPHSVKKQARGGARGCRQLAACGAVVRVGRRARAERPHRSHCVTRFRALRGRCSLSRRRWCPTRCGGSATRSTTSLTFWCVVLCVHVRDRHIPGGRVLGAGGCCCARASRVACMPRG